MRFCEIIGNDNVKKTLAAMADSGRIPHAMLFFENDGCGAFPLVIAYLQYLHCRNRHDGDSCGVCPSCNKFNKLIHPDTHFVYPVNTGTKSGDTKSKDMISEVYLRQFRELALANPYFREEDTRTAFGMEGKVGDINVAEAMQIVRKISLTPLEDGYKAVVMYLPETMNAQCANKLLKSIEEPPQNTIFLLITHSPEKVMQTIFSRCQSMRIMPLTRDEKTQVRAKWPVEDAEDHNEFLNLFSELIDAVMRRDLNSALDCADVIASFPSREKQKSFIAFMAESMRKIFTIQQGLSELSEADPQEMEYFRQTAGRLPKKFTGKVFPQLDRVALHLFRNVNQKILFTDMVNRIFMSI